MRNPPVVPPSRSNRGVAKSAVIARGVLQKLKSEPLYACFEGRFRILQAMVKTDPLAHR